LADEASKQAPNADTTYLIGSCTKGITATAICLLAERNKLSLDDTVSKYIPELQNLSSPEVNQQMTVKDLLSHCTGLSSMPYEVIVRWGEVIVRNREQAINIFNCLPTAAAFKSEWRYNNWTFVIASRLISHVSGETYHEFIENNILRPLGMSRTGFTDADENFAKAYMTFSDGTREERKIPTLTAGDAFEASGSIRSCVTDMLTWMQTLMTAHANDPNLSTSWTDRLRYMITGQFLRSSGEDAVLQVNNP
jgi:CubicO group peptidase (beta-lactamase class C family)